MQKYIIIALFIGILAPAQKVWTLEDCLDYAVKNNITVKKTVLDKTTASLNYQQQMNNKLPTIYGTTSLGLTNGSSIDPITSSFVNQNILSNSFGLSGNMTIYQGNKLNLQIEQNKMILDQKALEITKAGYKPTLSATAGLNTGFTSTQDYSYFNQFKNNFNKSVGLSLNVPIFSKKQNDTNVKLAQIDIEQNKLDKISASKTLYSSIETAWQNAIANQAQQKSSKVARDNAKLAYDLASKKYEFGGLTTTELAVSRNTYLANEQTYLQSKYMSVLYTQLLNFYQGKTLTAN
ncbi:TolC family protein [Epilithonimonas sp.]|uniref:TolC family protein n=1 Tax=Epilithonimonas sp. TaxID=2894511 RepID=UPI002896E3CF|nr:TolC family protein [Epilithonimonas sp.]